MKKLFKSIGIIGLILLSYVYTSQTINVIEETDQIMVKIKENKDNYEIKMIDNIVNGDIIIPGIKGRIVNVNKSYNNMKKMGIYNKDYFIYDYIYPNKIMDKYIVSGNKNKNMVSLVFILDNNTNINNIISILDKENIKSDFFITYNYLNKNTKLIEELINKGHGIHYYGNYNISDFNWTMLALNSLKEQTHFCYFKEKDDISLNACVNSNNYSIISSIEVKDSLYDLRKNLKSGSIVTVYDNLSLVINYIKSKGYKIDKLENHLSFDI